MAEKVDVIFQSVMSALQIAKLYSTEHPKFMKFLDNSYLLLQGHLNEKGDLVIGIVGDELAYEREILFELSKTLKPMISYLKSREIERIVFHKKMSKNELKRFIDFLNKPKEEIVHKDILEIFSAMEIKNITVGKIKLSNEGGITGGIDIGIPAIDYLGVYNGSLDNYTQTIDKILNNEDVDYLNLRFGVTNVMEHLLSRYQELLKLTAVKRYDITTFVHILNVSMLSMFFSFKLGLSKEAILDIGTAAMFHDIGKLYISRKIIKKTDKLSDEETQKVKNHSVFGAEILLRYVDTLGVLPVVVCFEHHLKYDLSGYPKVSLPHKIHLASSIVSICDVYDALFQRRSYKAGYSPNIVFDIMQKEKGRYFDPNILDAYFQVMGVWPIGTIVLLTDGTIAVVREENADNIYNPKVEIIVPQEKGKIVDLAETKGKLTIQKYLDPMSEAKEYVKLI